MQAQVASITPAKLFPLLGKRKRPLSGLPAQAAYAKHAKLLAISAKVAKPESKAVEPPEKLVKYFQGTIRLCNTPQEITSHAQPCPVGA